MTSDLSFKSAGLILKAKLLQVMKYLAFLSIIIFKMPIFKPKLKLIKFQKSSWLRILRGL